MKILLTGAGGVVGAEVAAHLGRERSDLAITRVGRQRGSGIDVAWVIGEEPPPEELRGHWAGGNFVQGWGRAAPWGGAPPAARDAALDKIRPAPKGFARMDPRPRRSSSNMRCMSFLLAPNRGTIRLEPNDAVILEEILSQKEPLHSRGPATPPDTP